VGAALLAAVAIPVLRHFIVKGAALEHDRTVSQLELATVLGADDYADAMRRAADALLAPKIDGLVRQLEDWNREIAKHPAKSPEDVFNRPLRKALQKLVEGFKESAPDAPVDHWVLLDAASTMVGRTPELSTYPVIGLEFSDRDYFREAKRHIGMTGKAAVHVSFGYQSVADLTFKYTLSRPLAAEDGKTLVGVLGVSTTARLRSDLGLLLVAPRDPEQLSDADAARHPMVLLEHPELGSERGAVPFYSARLAAVAPRQCGHELEKPRGVPADHVFERFRDPLADSLSDQTWLATVSPVARTGFLVINKNRRQP
jgi:hypothetical protein